MDPDKLQRKLAQWWRLANRRASYLRREAERVYGNRERIKADLSKKVQSQTAAAKPVVFNFNNLTKGAVLLTATATFFAITDFVDDVVRERNEQLHKELTPELFESGYVSKAAPGYRQCLKQSYAANEKRLRRVTVGTAGRLLRDCEEIVEMAAQFKDGGMLNPVAKCFAEATGIDLAQPNDLYSDEPGKSHKVANGCWAKYRPNRYAVPYTHTPKPPDAKASQPQMLNQD